uniref:Uncharacterized protein n=1 Tax=Triticum urartu TaxID=4572 RepID=A0A8R7V0C6_TRIUA
MRDKHREQLWRKNKLMTLEVVEQITANKNAQGRPENFKSLLQRVQLTVALKSKNFASANTLLDNLMIHIQKVRSTCYQLGRSKLLRVIVSTRPFSSTACNMFGAGKGSCWIPFDLFMESAMDGRHLRAISSIEALTELSKMLQAINRATWQETFQALWISALRLIHRDPSTLEGPLPHLDSRLCMLLAIVPLAIAPILKEYANNVEPGVASIRIEELMSSLQVLGQFFGLLSPPPATVHATNIAATKAAIAVYSLKAGSENIHNSSKDSFSVKLGICYI